MGNTNASPTLFGFDFQVNAAIFLMLDNIKKGIRGRTLSRKVVNILTKILQDE